MAQFSQYSSPSLLRPAFGSFLPEALLAPTNSAAHGRWRIFSLELFAGAFSTKCPPNGACRKVVRKVMADSPYILRPDQELGGGLVIQIRL